MLDYIIVGLGLAGISFCEELQENGKSFRVISANSQQASLVAGGLYNPVILKRFTLAWNAKEQLDLALPFYQNLEKKLKIKLDYKVSVLRRFTAIEEQNNWFAAADKHGLDYFLDVALLKNNNPNIDAPFGYGKVKDTGRIDTKTLLRAYENDLIAKDRLIKEEFDFSSLQILGHCIAYRGIAAKNIVFAEGFGLKSNPYFKYLPLNGTKGELLTIKAPLLKEENVIKSSVFIIPLGNNLYRVGATYKWKDKTNSPTKEAKDELLGKLKSFLKCDFNVVTQVAGVRPTVADRRPLVGRHPGHSNLYVLNGFGSRGVMIAPYASKKLYNFIENDVELNREMDSCRFTKKYYSDLFAKPLS